MATRFIGSDAHIREDWPSSRLFKDKFSALYEDFIASIPFRDFVVPNGVGNLAANVPDNAHDSDLGPSELSLILFSSSPHFPGPKMYIAMGSTTNDHGSTKLHMDVTDAVNLLVYSSAKDKEAVCAIWHLFPPNCIPGLRAFLRANCNSEDDEDPIHSQSIYLTPALLDLLYKTQQIRPIVIEQRVGQTVWIPSQWPHQVRVTGKWGTAHTQPHFI